MIVAADEFIPGNGIPVDSVVIDRKNQSATDQTRRWQSLKNCWCCGVVMKMRSNVWIW